MKIDLHMVYFDKTPICTVQGNSFILFHLATRTSSICDGVFFKTKHHIDILYHPILASIDKVSSDNELLDLCVC